ncbi:MAG: hypothetical protein GYA21_02680 [Myxococcales bacterium]|nr:hypothetical protein [Myxococcales bacterium]
MTCDRELMESASRTLSSLRRMLDEDPSQAVAHLREALTCLGRIEEHLGAAEPLQPAREVVRRYLTRLRASLEDLLMRRMREDPGCEEILAGEVLPLSEGLEGLCRSLAAGTIASRPTGSREA